MSMSLSFSETFFMPDGVDPYDIVAPWHGYPTSLAEALMLLDDAEFKSLCERADVHPEAELAWHECMTWVREEVNSCVPTKQRTRVHTSTDGWDSVDVYNREYSARLVSGEEEE